MHCRAFTRPLPRVRDPLRKKREKENSPTSQSFRTSSAVSVCVTPPLPSTLRWMRPASSLGVPQPPPPAFCSSPPTILHTLAILKTYIHLLPPSLLMLLVRCDGTPRWGAVPVCRVKGQERGPVAEAWATGQTPGRVVADVVCFRSQRPSSADAAHANREGT